MVRNRSACNGPITPTSTKPDAKCSICGKLFFRSASKAYPFCSTRCQQIDLGAWLDERLGLPVEGHEEQEFTGYEDEEVED